MQDFLKYPKQFYAYLKKDTWDSWLVSLLLIVVFIKFIFFPGLSLITGAPLPIVVVESCSMYHESGFEEWWNKNHAWYETNGIKKPEFREFSFKNGLNKGDIIFVWGHSEYQKGDIIIFNAQAKHPLIHRIVTENPISTKGDHNSDQLNIEKNISEENIIGKSAIRVPLIGWLKLIFFEPFRSPSQRGFC
jgi:hypothetical protein